MTELNTELTANKAVLGDRPLFDKIYDLSSEERSPLFEEIRQIEAENQSKKDKALNNIDALKRDIENLEEELAHLESQYVDVTLGLDAMVWDNIKDILQVVGDPFNPNTTKERLENKWPKKKTELENSITDAYASLEANHVDLDYAETRLLDMKEKRKENSKLREQIQEFLDAAMNKKSVFFTRGDYAKVFKKFKHDKIEADRQGLPSIRHISDREAELLDMYFIYPETGLLGYLQEKEQLKDKLAKGIVEEASLLEGQQKTSVGDIIEAASHAPEVNEEEKDLDEFGMTTAIPVEEINSELEKMAMEANNTEAEAEEAPVAEESSEPEETETGEAGAIFSLKSYLQGKGLNVTLSDEEDAELSKSFDTTVVDGNIAYANESGITGILDNPKLLIKEDLISMIDILSGIGKLPIEINENISILENHNSNSLLQMLTDFETALGVPRKEISFSTYNASFDEVKSIMDMMGVEA